MFKSGVGFGGAGVTAIAESAVSSVFGTTVVAPAVATVGATVVVPIAFVGIIAGLGFG